MTDRQWLMRFIYNPNEDELYFFVERVRIILDGNTLSEEHLEKARNQAFEELKLHDF